MIFGTKQDETSGKTSFDWGSIVKWMGSTKTPNLLEKLGVAEATTIFNEYDANADGAAEATQKFLDSVKDQGMRAYLATVDHAHTSYAEYTASVDKANAATLKFSLSTKLASVGMKALSMAANMAIIMAVSFAVQKAFEGIDYLLHKVERDREYIKNLESQFSELGTEIEGVESELAKVSDRLKELRGKGQITLLEQGELTKLEAASSSLRLQLEILNKRKQIQAREILDRKTGLYKEEFESRNLFETLRPEAPVTQAQIDDQVAKSIETGIAAGESSLLGQIGAYKAAQELKAKAIEEGNRLLAAGNNDLAEVQLDLANNVYQKNIDDADAKLTKYAETLQGFISDLEAEESRTDPQNAALNSAKKNLEMLFVNAWPDKWANIHFGEIFDAKEFVGIKTTLTDLAKAGTLTAETLSQPAYSTFVARMHEAGIGIEQIIAQLAALREQADADFAAQNSPGSLAESLTKLQENLDLVKTAQEESDASGSVSYETYQKLAEAGKEYVGVLDEIDGRLVVNTDRMRELEDAQIANIDAEVDHAKALKQAEYDKVTQQLEAVQDAYKGMVEAGADRSDLDKQKDVINIFKAKQAQIQKEIAQYAALSGQINAAATSLKRYRDAKNTANLGDNTKFAASDTKKTLQEARKTGEYNTDDVKTGIEYFTGKKAKTQKELKAFAKESKKIEDRYFTDNSKKNVRNLADDLLNKKKMGELSKFISKDKNGIVTIDDDVTNEQLAEKLGISTDALRDLFDTWKLIDADADWDERIKKLSPTSDQAEEVKTKAEELASNIDDGTKSISEANERRREALEETARLEAGDLTGGQAPEPPKPKEPNLPPTPEVQGPPKPSEADLTSQIENLKSELSGLVDTYNKLSGLNIAVQFTPETAAADITAIREAILQLSQGDNAVTGSVEFTGADDANAKLTTYTANLDTLVKNYKDGKIPTEVFFGMAADFLGNINAAKEYLSSIPKTVDATATVDAQPGDTLTVSDLVKDADDEGKLHIDIIPQIKEPVGYVPENDYGGNPPAGSGLPSDNEGFSGYTPPASEETVTVDTEVGETVTPGELVDGVDSNWNARIQAHTGVTRKLTPDDLVSGLINGELPIKVKPEVSGQVPIPTSPSASGAKEATGTRHAKKGVALVDEEGPELIEHVKDGTWEIGNGDGARFVPLGDRDIVHTADDTKKIFKRAVSYGGAFRSGAYPDDGGGGGGKTPTKTNSKKSGNWKKLVKDLFDWIEIRVAALQRVTDNWTKSIQHTVGYIAKNIKLDLAIKNVDAQIDTAQKGHAKYMELLATLRGKMKLKPDMVAQIEDGSIDVSKLKPKVREMVEEYKKWYDKANALQDSLADLEEQQRDLAKQKLDNIAQDYGFKVDRIDAQIANAEARRNSKIATGQEVTDDDYVADIEANNKKLKVLAEQRAEMQRELSNLVASGMIQQGSEDWHNYTGQIEELDVALLDVKASLGEIQKEIYDLNVEKLNYALDALKHVQETAENLIDNKVASGRKINAADYIPMLAASEQQIANLQEQIALARKAQEGMDINSELYQELEGDIRSNESAIWDAQKAQIEWNDAIKDIPLKELQWTMNAINAIKDKLEGLRNLNEAQKIDVNKEYYQSLVDNGMDEISNLENQNQLLREKIIGMDVESEKYQEIKAQIEANEQAILGVKAAQEEWVDSIVDIRIDRIKKLQEELQKTNDKYERRVELEKALENLEKARQRTKLMYVEGEGFVYRRDEKAFKDAEKALKDVQHKEHMAKLDDLKDALEESKKDNNIYDRNGNIIVPVDWNTLGVNLDVFQQNLMDGLHLDNYAAQLFEQMGLGGAVSYGSVDNSNRPSVAFTMEEGAIQISGAGDPELVANAVGSEFLRIVQGMPMYVAQEMNKRQ